MMDSGWAVLRRAGTLMMAAMVLVWALLYFPRVDAMGNNYDTRIAALRDELGRWNDKASLADGDEKAKFAKDAERLEKQINAVEAEWQGQSMLGLIGHKIEPVVRPLGWDWRIGMAALASFPAPWVADGTLGTLSSQRRP